MKQVAFTLLAAFAAAGCNAAEGPLDSVPVIVPKVSLPSPKVVIPASIRIPTPNTTRPSAYRLEVDVLCGGVFEYEEPSPLGLIELFGSVAAFRDALSSQTVEVVELMPSRNLLSPSVEYADRAVALPAPMAKAVRTILTSDSSFDWENPPVLDSRPEVRLKFKNGGRIVAFDLFLFSRCTRLVKDGVVGPLVRIDAGFEDLDAIMESHFPGVIRRKG